MKVYDYEFHLWTQKSKGRAVTLTGSLPSVGKEEGMGSCFVLWWKLKMACCKCGFSRDAQLQATVNTSCWCKAFVLYMMWLTLARSLCCWRRSDCHYQVAEFLIHKFKRMFKSKFRASNTLFNSAEYAITRKVHCTVVSLPKHLARTQQQWHLQILPL
jgi:hypothetical protein